MLLERYRCQLNAPTRTDQTCVLDGQRQTWRDVTCIVRRVRTFKNVERDSLSVESSSRRTLAATPTSYKEKIYVLGDSTRHFVAVFSASSCCSRDRCHAIVTHSRYPKVSNAFETFRFRNMVRMQTLPILHNVANYFVMQLR